MSKEVKSATDEEIEIEKRLDHVGDGARTHLALIARIDELTAERDDLFLRLGKCVDVPALDYWQDRAEKAEAKLKIAVEALRVIGGDPSYLQSEADYWLRISHTGCAETLATDTDVARTALKEIEE